MSRRRLAAAAFLSAVLSFIAASSPRAYAAPCVVHVLDAEHFELEYGYDLELLRLIFAKTEAQFGPCAIEKFAITSHNRKIHLARQEKLDIVSNVSTKELEEQLTPIRIPIHHGLQGLRLLVIRKGDEGRFAAVKNLADLRALNAGLRADWQAVQVLQANQLPVVGNDDFESLFGMLGRGRFDYLPLALFEVAGEVTKRASSGLALESHLLLRYPSVDYYFVPKGRTDLEARIRAGMTAAVADGSRDALWEKFFNYKAMVHKLNLEGRLILDLANPFHPAVATKQQTDLWFQLPDVLRLKG